jgi:hypothetical protein
VEGNSVWVLKVPVDAGIKDTFRSKHGFASPPQERGLYCGRFMNPEDRFYGCSLDDAMWQVALEQKILEQKMLGLQDPWKIKAHVK